MYRFKKFGHLSLQKYLLPVIQAIDIRLNVVLPIGDFRIYPVNSIFFVAGKPTATFVHKIADRKTVEAAFARLKHAIRPNRHVFSTAVRLQ